MKLEVPFHLQTTKLNCGPAALKMVLAYLGKEYDMSILEKETGIVEGKGVFTIQMGIAATSFGYKAEFYSKQVTFNKENLKLDFYKKYIDLALEIDKTVQRAKDLGVKVEERGVSLEEILSNVNEHSLPIILLDWNIVKNDRSKGYHGHFVPIVGYDEEYIYVHNQGLNNPKPFWAIEKGIFEEARKANGTDEDILFIKK